MATKVRIGHDGEGWAELFRSFQPLVDSVGQRIAAEANAGLDEPMCAYKAAPANFYARGYVNTVGLAGAIEQATNKTLTRAVHR